METVRISVTQAGTYQNRDANGKLTSGAKAFRGSKKHPRLYQVTKEMAKQIVDSGKGKESKELNKKETAKKA